MNTVHIPEKPENISDFSVTNEHIDVGGVVADGKGPVFEDLVVVLVDVERDAFLWVNLESAGEFSTEGKDALLGLASFEILDATLQK